MKLVSLAALQVRQTFHVITFIYGGTQWRSWLRHCATSRKVTGAIPNVVINIILPVDSAFNRNEFQAAVAWVDNLHVPIVLKSGSFSLLEPSGPVQGLLYLYLTFMYERVHEC